MKKKKVLFVVPFLPYPLISGGHQGIFNGLLSVADTVDIILTYPEAQDQSKEKQELIERFGEKIILAPYMDHQNMKGERLLEFIYRTKFFIKMMIKGKKAVIGRRSPYEDWIQLLMPKSEGFLKHINALILKHSVDIVQCEMIQSLAVILSLPKTVKRIFIQHEIGFVQKSLNPILLEEPLAGQSQLDINRLIEIYLLNQYDTVVALSSIDTEKLLKAGVHAQLYTSFTTVSVPSETVLESNDFGVLSFIGPEMHQANREGLIWFLDHCWEPLQHSGFRFSLNIIGYWSK